MCNRKLTKKEQIEKRAYAVSEYILDTRCTLREAADYFGISKTTAHNDVVRIKQFDYRLYTRVKSILDYNNDVRSIRAGISTKVRNAIISKNINETREYFLNK